MLSVILCAHNPREKLLRRTLEHLRQQTLPPEQWELLLIDNASDTDLARQYDLTWHPQGRHLREPVLGLTAARLAGIKTNRVLVGVYTFAGLAYGIAALLQVARTGVGDPQAGQTSNLDSITAVVLGGTSLFGGRGSIVGTLIGALIVGVFRNGLQLMGVESTYQVLITGILVIAAVSVDQLTHRK